MNRLLVEGLHVCVGPFAGDEQSGDLATEPVDHALVDEATQVQLETNPPAPRSVNTWIGVTDGAIYVPRVAGLVDRAPADVVDVFASTLLKAND